MLIRYSLISLIFLLSACQSTSEFEDVEGFVLDYETCIEIINDKDKTHRIWSTPRGFTGVSKDVCDQVIFETEFSADLEEAEGKAAEQ